MISLKSAASLRFKLTKMTRAIYFFFLICSASATASESRFRGEKRNWAFADLMTPDGSFDFDSKRSFQFPSEYGIRKRQSPIGSAWRDMLDRASDAHSADPMLFHDLV